MRRGDDAHVDPEGLLPAHAADFALLERPQQLDLHRDRGVSDLVEEERPAVGPLEGALVLRGGSGEGALLVAEELRFEQRFREGAAVDRDERPRRAAAVGMQRTRHQFLAGAALALDHHRGHRVGQGLDLRDHGAHGFRFGDHRPCRELVAERGGEVVDAVAEAAGLGRAAQGRFELVQVERLLDVVIRAGLEGAHAGVDRAVGRHHDHGHAAVELLDAPQNLDAVDVGQHQIRQHQRGALLAEGGHARLARAGDQHLEPPVGGGIAHRGGAVGIILDHQEFDGHAYVPFGLSPGVDPGSAALGTVSRMRAPPPSRPSARIVPPQ